MNKKISIKTSLIINPYNLYVISFLCVLLAFSLRWSEIYASLEKKLLIFILITSLISLILGGCKSIKKRSVFRRIAISSNNKKVLLIILLGTMAQFVVAGGIPIVTIVFGGLGNYRDFVGIPMLGPIISYLNIIWSIYLFYQYQSNLENKKILWYYLISLLPFLLVLNRGALMQVMCPCFFIFLLRIKNLYLKTLVKILVGIFLFFVAFGVIGNVRDSANIENEVPTILRLGGASEEFIDSKIPKSLFWGYIYAASPLANLQCAIKYSEPDISYDNLTNTVIESCMPDIISNRLSGFVKPHPIDPSNYLVSSVFNASSVYFLPYLRLGWVGMILMFLFMVLMVKLYILLVPISSSWFMIGWSFLLCIILLNTFNNMWNYSGLSVMIMIVLFSFLEKKHIKKYEK